MQVTWFGHSMWKFTALTNTIGFDTVIIDPFGGDIGYSTPYHPTADVVVSTHDHFDHNRFDIIEGDFIKITEEGHYEIKGMTIDTIQVWHDKNHGKDRGKNLLVKVNMEGLNILHCGDLGHIPDDDIIKKLGKIDLLFVPIGGTYTLDPYEAKQLVDILKPNIVFPMHYLTPVVNFRELEPAHKFWKLYNEDDVVLFHTNEVTVAEKALPKFAIYILLRYS